MNFLNKAKAVANNNTKNESPLGNPFLKKKENVSEATPQVKPPVPGKPPIGAKPPVAGKPPIGAKPPIPGKPPIAGKPPVIVKPPVTATEEKPKVEEKPVVKEEEKKVAPTKTEEVKVEEPKTPETPKEEPKAEEAKKKTKTKAKAAKKAEKEANVKEEIAEEIIIPVTEMDYAKAVDSIRSSFVDEKYESLKKELDTRLSEIIISNDLNKAQINDLLSQIAIFKDEIARTFIGTKTLYENLTAKDDGLIERVKKLNAKGSNAEERKVSGMVAAMNYKTKEGHNINLYELLEETRDRYNFFKDLMDRIEFKKSVLLTMLSSLKNER